MLKETSRAAEIRQRIEAMPGCKIVSKEVREIREPLTPEELVVIAQEMTGHILKANEIEEEKKAITKKLKDQIDEENAQATALAQTYEKGYEDNETDVFVVADFQAKIRRIFSIKTGLQVYTEILQDRDLQEEMKLKPAAEKAKSDAKEAQPAEGEAKMGDGEVIIVANPERIALGFEGSGGETGEIAGNEGLTVTEADYEVLGNLEQAPEPVIETETLITQIRSVEEKEKVAYITTAENVILFTDDKDAISTAKKNAIENKDGAKEGKSFFVEIKYIKSETRNQQMVSIADREVPQTGEDAPQAEPIIADGYEIDEADEMED